MWQYLVKRVLRLIVTLFGISLLSFLIVTSAPGDPASMKAAAMGQGGASGISKFTTDKNRELFFLDRPPLLNLDPATRSSTVSKYLGRVNAELELERKDARTRLVSDLGTSALDGLLAALPKLSQESLAEAEKRKQLLDGLEAASEAELPEKLAALAQAYPLYEPQLAHVDGQAPPPERFREVWLRQRKTMLDEAEAPARRVLEVLSATPKWKRVQIDGILSVDRGGPDIAEDTPLAKAVEMWATWWGEHKSEFSTAAAEQAAQAWLKAAEGALPKDELAKAGQLAAPTLMDAMTSAEPGSAEEQRAAAGLVLVCKKPWTLQLTPEEITKLELEWTEAKKVIDEKELPPSVKAGKLEALGEQKGYVEQQTAETLEKRRERWAAWWYRAEEYYVEFGTGAQMARGVTQTQFGRWMSRFVRFDFGDSYKHKRPVDELILERLKVTLPLNAVSLALIYLFALPIGIYSATHRGSTGDRASSLGLFVLYSIPSFWAGAMLIMLFTGEPFLSWFPSHHIESINNDEFTTTQKLLDWGWHGFLPVICLTYGGIAYVAKQMRAGMLDVIRQDYIRTARAKGLPEGRVVYKHALRNGLIPVLTLMASLLPFLFGGSVIIEQIFSIEGLGKLMFDALLDRDYPVLMANLVIAGFLTLLGILITDIAYAIVDPRIEYR